MARKSLPASDLVVSPDYVEELQSALDRSGLSRRRLAALAGISPPTVGRVLNDGGRGATIEAIDAVRRALNDVADGPGIPPPAIPVRDRDDWLWHLAKEKLRDSGMFQEVLVEVLDMSGVMTPEARERLAMRRLKNLRKTVTE